MTGQQILGTAAEPKGHAEPVRVENLRGKILALAAALILTANGRPPGEIYAFGPTDNIIALSGRIEGDDSAVAAKTSGCILDDPRM